MLHAVLNDQAILHLSHPGEDIITTSSEDSTPTLKYSEVATPDELLGCHSLRTLLQVARMAGPLDVHTLSK